jgi:hypothetical protein
MALLWPDRGLAAPGRSSAAESGHGAGTRRRRTAVLSLALALGLALAGPQAVPVAAVDPEPPGDCPGTMPLAAVEAGQTGIGWTVVRGTEPRPFAVEVLGVYPNGIQPGHDIILVRVSDLGGSGFIERVGGIWAGMSGSPVYIDGQLVGAVAYGFSAGPSTLGGLTPVEEMLEVGDLEPTTITGLSPRLRRALQGVAPATTGPSGFGRLALPVTLPPAPRPAPRGAGAARRAEMRARFDLGARLADRGLESVSLTAPARAVFSSSANARPVAGGNFGASLSYGDLEIVGIGTATIVCDQRVLAFGHPLLHTGRANLGAHLARSLEIVDDPTLTPYKLAVTGDVVGRVGQDRTAGVGGRLDQEPKALKVTSATRHRALARTRSATTRVPSRDPRFLRWLLPANHAYQNVLTVADGREEGSVGMELRVTGKRADGRPFGVTFGDRWLAEDSSYASVSDTATAALYGVGIPLSWLVENPFERVEVEDVELGLDLARANRWLVQGMTVSRNGGRPRTGPTVCVARGDRLTVRVQLSSSPGGRPATRTLKLVVPRRFATLRVEGGRGISPWDDPSMYGSFDGLLEGLADTARSDELVATIVARRTVQRETRATAGRITVGGTAIALRPIGSTACR